LISRADKLSTFYDKVYQLDQTCSALARFNARQISEELNKAQLQHVNELNDSLFEIEESREWRGGGKYKHQITECNPLHSIVTDGLESQKKETVEAVETLLTCLDRLIQLRVHLNPKQIHKKFKDTRPTKAFLEQQRDLFIQSIKNLCGLLKQFFMPLKPETKDSIEKQIISTASLINLKALYHQKAIGMKSNMREALGLARNSDGTVREREHHKASHAYRADHKRSNRNHSSLPGVARIERLGGKTYRFIDTDGVSITHTGYLDPRYAHLVVDLRKRV
jgi:hypothetical protein